MSSIYRSIGAVSVELESEDAVVAALKFVVGGDDYDIAATGRRIDVRFRGTEPYWLVVGLMREAALGAKSRMVHMTTVEATLPQLLAAEEIARDRGPHGATKWQQRAEIMQLTAGTYADNVGFRSKLEKMHREELDRLGLVWDYEPESLRVSEVAYQPDFSVENGVLEVKGRMDPFSASKILRYVEALPAQADWFVVSFGTIPKSQQPWVYVRDRGWIDMWSDWSSSYRWDGLHAALVAATDRSVPDSAFRASVD